MRVSSALQRVRNHSRTTGLGVIVAGSALIAAVGTASSAQASTPAFKITKVRVTPDPLIANGKNGTQFTSWTGHPTFPVTIYDKSRSCPSGIVCNPVRHKFTKPSDPLVWQGAWHCQGTVPSGFEFKYWIWAVDAHGVKTAQVQFNLPCKNR